MQVKRKRGGHKDRIGAKRRIDKRIIRKTRIEICSVTGRVIDRGRGRGRRRKKGNVASDEQI